MMKSVIWFLAGLCVVVNGGVTRGNDAVRLNNGDVERSNECLPNGKIDQDPTFSRGNIGNTESVLNVRLTNDRNNQNYKTINQNNSSVKGSMKYNERLHEKREKTQLEHENEGSNKSATPIEIFNDMELKTNAPMSPDVEGTLRPNISQQDSKNNNNTLAYKHNMHTNTTLKSLDKDNSSIGEKESVNNAYTDTANNTNNRFDSKATNQENKIHRDNNREPQTPQALSNRPPDEKSKTPRVTNLPGVEEEQIWGIAEVMTMKPLLKTSENSKNSDLDNRANFEVAGCAKDQVMINGICTEGD